MRESYCFFFKLLVGLGAHPEGALLDDLQVARLRAISLEHYEITTYVTHHQALIKDWLCRCVTEHPRAKEFKTTRFLMRD